MPGLSPLGIPTEHGRAIAVNPIQITSRRVPAGALAQYCICSLDTVWSDQSVCLIAGLSNSEALQRFHIELCAQTGLGGCRNHTLSKLKTVDCKLFAQGIVAKRGR